MKKFFKFLLYFFLATTVIGVLTAIFSPDGTNSSSKSATGSNNVDTTALVSESPISTSKWSYSETVDKMTDKKSYFAQIEANDLLYFEFPYNGGVTATLIIRSIGSVRDVVLNITKGQFMPNTMGSESVKVRFDDKPAKKYSYQGAGDGSTENIFLNNKKQFIIDIKKSKKLIIESCFYDNGSHVMEFDTEGLEWNH